VNHRTLSAPRELAFSEMGQTLLMLFLLVLPIASCASGQRGLALSGWRGVEQRTLVPRPIELSTERFDGQPADVEPPVSGSLLDGGARKAGGPPQ
jgi:hypothetical protein